MAWEIKTHEITAPVPSSQKWFAWYERETTHGIATYGRGWGKTAAEAKIELHAKWAEYLFSADEELEERHA